MHNEYDHRVLGAKYDLFSFFEEGPGFPVWHDKGLRIKNALIAEWRRLHLLSGYREIQSPILLDKELWKKSGHCDYFEQNMFFSEVEKRDYAVKPMNCPGAILYYEKKRRSFAHLPLRICELGHVHRFENSGSLHGLLRVRAFVQDDAHIFCSGESILDEIKGIVELIKKLMNKCGLRDYHFELSQRGDKKGDFLGSDSDWAFAESKLEEAMIELGINIIKRPGEAKFYGPSLDLHIKDVHGRSWQCSSIQLDFNLPQRFGLYYVDPAGNKKVPYMLHRAIFGSLERFIGILLENFGKELPLWLHPEPYRILILKDEYRSYAEKIKKEFDSRGINCEIDVVDKSLGSNLKGLYSEFIHSVIIIGNKEVQSGALSIKNLINGKDSRINLGELINLF